MSSYNDINLEKKLFLDSDCYNNYLEIVKKTANLLINLNISNPVEISLVFEYLLWNGYFSNEHFLKYSMKDRIADMYAPGISIMGGASVCLNNSDMLCQLLTTLDFNSKVITTNFIKKGPIQYSFPIDLRGKSERTSINNNKFKKTMLNILGNIFGNHAISVFQYEDNYYFVDPTNLFFLNPYKGLKLIDISEKVIMTPTFLGNTMIIVDLFNTISYEELSDICSYLLGKKYSEENLLTSEKVDFLNKSIYEFCENNMALFEDFHIEIKSNIDIVCKTLKRMR